MMEIIFGSACLHRRRLIALHYIVEPNMIQFGDKSIWELVTGDCAISIADRNVDEYAGRRQLNHLT